MKENNCAVFKDLYPTYLNEQLEEETIEWVEEHIDKCQDCKRWIKEHKAVEAKNENIKEVVVMQENEIKIIKRARLFLTIGMIIVIILALWTSLWAVS